MRQPSEIGLDTRAAAQRALLITPLRPAEFSRDPDLRLAEAAGLAEALDLIVVNAQKAPLRRIHPGLYFGRGRVDALKQEIADLAIDLAIVDSALSPVQQRNLERALNAKVMDRTGLILEIFARRARTREGRLQVELARLAYERSRLVRTWTHLERQRGGLGKTGGPGETQIELDRRAIAARIDKLERETQSVRRTRGLHRRARRRAGLLSIVLVGYTNAGKSTLFNRLTDAGVLAKDMPFATLDPTARLIKLPSGREAILSDTVGFITDLPTELIAAFRATLEEVNAADLLLHVRDIAHPESDQQRRDVESVLSQIVDQEEAPPLLEVWNKVDLLSQDRREARSRRTDDSAVAVSAASGDGIDLLLDVIDHRLNGPTRVVSVKLDAKAGRLRAWIGAHGRVLEEAIDEDGLWSVRAELPAADAERLERETAG